MEMEINAESGRAIFTRNQHSAVHKRRPDAHSEPVWGTASLLGKPPEGSAEPGNDNQRRNAHEDYDAVINPGAVFMVGAVVGVDPGIATPPVTLL